MTHWRKQTADEVYAAEEVDARLEGRVAEVELRGRLDPPQVQDQRLEGHADGGQHRRPPRRGGLAPPGPHRVYAFVTVKLMNHAAKGITEKDFELARKIEEVRDVATRRQRRARRSKARRTTRASST